ncbi:hypothetical protein V7S43_009996 [Phytophthora oleae]|uniref:Uncharacterized protein n=1 Tax=Phytophthora oleae TaxID=2107226 RepID=A0ABD3FEW7_9STRA
MNNNRTKRKNLQKRRKRRLFAVIAAEIQASVCTHLNCRNIPMWWYGFPALIVVLEQEEAQKTPDQKELEQMRNEEERQRTHEQWKKSVEKSNAIFDKKRKILAQRQKLILSLRQQMQ